MRFLNEDMTSLEAAYQLKQIIAVTLICPPLIFLAFQNRQTRHKRNRPRESLSVLAFYGLIPVNPKRRLFSSRFLQSHRIEARFDISQVR